MPVYEYQCTNCDHSFELKQSFDAEPICSCPACSNEAKRLFKPAPIIFKGSGFYVTDYNGKSPSHSAESEDAKFHSSPDAAPKESHESNSSTVTAAKTDN